MERLHKGKVKGKLFALTYARAKRAIGAGFYLEAVSLCESMILSRLIVILESNLEGDFSKFSVGKASNNLISHKVNSFDPVLWDDCLAWSTKRNFLSHKMADLGDSVSSDWRGRLALGKETALEGISLANRCSAESRKHRL